jgi:hypothetical protein
MRTEDVFMREIDGNDIDAPVEAHGSFEMLLKVETDLEFATSLDALLGSGIAKQRTRTRSFIQKLCRCPTNGWADL